MSNEDAGRRARRAGFAVAAVAFAAAMGSCSAEVPPTDVPEVVVSVSPTATDLAAETLPLDAYALTADQYSDLDFAIKLLAKACMERFGIDWDTGGRITLPNNGRNYGLGLVDADRASSYGYHPTPEERTSQSNSGDTGRGLTSEEAIILGGVGPGEQPQAGVPDGGCYGEARRTLGWSEESFIWLQQLASQAMMLTLEHANTQAANARWSECMKMAGYDYGSPSDANNDQAWWGDDSAGPSEREINTAVADVHCKVSTNYVGEVTAVLAANQQRLVEDNFEQLESIRHQVEEALRRAADILANPPA